MIETPKTEIRPLTGLRGIAALSVAFGHYHLSLLSPVFAVLSWKNAAVDLFFCLSGFTLCLVYRVNNSDRLDFGGYLTARIARIYPLYLLTMIASSFIVHRPDNSGYYDRRALPWDFLREMTMTNAWSSLSDGRHWNFPAWSVSVEFFCYLFVFPLLFRAGVPRLGRNCKGRLILSILLVAASCFVFQSLFDQRIMRFGRNPKVEIPEIAYSVNLIRGVLGFTAGWVIYASYASRDQISEWAARHSNGIALGILGVLTAALFGAVPLQLIILGFPLLILGVASGDSAIARGLSWQPFTYLGRISYSVYLLHMPWFDLASQRLHLVGMVPTEDWSSTIIIVGGLLVVASISYFTVEIPLRRLVRSLWRSSSEDAQERGRRIGLGMAFAAVVVGLAFVQADRIGLLHPAPQPFVAIDDEITQVPIFERVAVKGWSTREDWGMWTDGPEAQIIVPIREKLTPRTLLAIKGSFFVTDRHRSDSARLSVNGIEIGNLSADFGDNTIDVSFALPEAALLTDSLDIRLDVANPTSPQSLGLSKDGRMLGFGLKSLRLVRDSTH